MATAKRDDSYSPFGVDEGDYDAIVIEVLEKSSDKYDKKPFLIWNFKVSDPIRGGEYVDDDVTVNGTTPSVTQEGQKLDKWLRACGVNLEDGETIGTDDLAGKHVRIFVEKTKNKGTGKEYCAVTKLLPFRSKPKSAMHAQDKQKPLGRKPSSTEQESDPEAEDIIEDVARKEAAAKKSAARAVQSQKPNPRGSASSARKGSEDAAAGDSNEDLSKSEEDALFGDFEGEGSDG